MLNMRKAKKTYREIKVALERLNVDYTVRSIPSRLTAIYAVLKRAQNQNLAGHPQMSTSGPSSNRTASQIASKTPHLRPIDVLLLKLKSAGRSNKEIMAQLKSNFGVMYSPGYVSARCKRLMVIHGRAKDEQLAQGLVAWKPEDVST